MSKLSTTFTIEPIPQPLSITTFGCLINGDFFYMANDPRAGLQRKVYDDRQNTYKRMDVKDSTIFPCSRTVQCVLVESATLSVSR